MTVVVSDRVLSSEFIIEEEYEDLKVQLDFIPV